MGEKEEERKRNKVKFNNCGSFSFSPLEFANHARAHSLTHTQTHTRSQAINLSDQNVARI